VLCGDRSDEALVCGACARRLVPCVPDAFLACAPIDGIDDGAAAFDYRFPLDRLVHRFKFAGDLATGRWLSLQLAEAICERARPDVLVAPPLTDASLRARGFNQAIEIAKVVGARVECRVDLDCIVKVRDTPPQPGLTGRARRRNLRGAFRCERSFDGLHVAVVDDVITTGATMAAVAEALRGRGAARVSAWAVARTPGPRG